MPAAAEMRLPAAGPRNLNCGLDVGRGAAAGPPRPAGCAASGEAHRARHSRPTNSPRNKRKSDAKLRAIMSWSLGIEVYTIGVVTASGFTGMDGHGGSRGFDAEARLGADWRLRWGGALSEPRADMVMVWRG